MNVSPFNFADKIKKPLLLIHGEADNNPGTFPIQSERLYQAIKGNGGTARLVLLPHESHGYRARESVLHVLAEMFDWAGKLAGFWGQPRSRSCAKEVVRADGPADYVGGRYSKSSSGREAFLFRLQKTCESAA